MVSEYQDRIMKMGNIQFEDNQDTDILTFEAWEQGFGQRCMYYLYSSNGDLKDVVCGKFIPLSEKKFGRPDIGWRKRLVVDPELYPKKEKSSKKKLEFSKKEQIPLSNKEKTPSSGKRRYNMSPEDALRRKERMREVAKRYWAKKKGIVL